MQSVALCGVDGEYRDGKIIISPRATNPVMTVAVHELTHHMESSSRYGEFSRMVLDYVSDEMGVDIDTMKNAIRSEYAKGGFELDDVGAERELVAKFAESKLFQDEAAINRLARTNRSMLQTVKDWISDMVVKLTGTEEEKFFRNAERLYEKALREVGDTANTNDGQAQYSIEETPNGKKYVRADRQVIFGNDPDSWSEQLENHINRRIREGQDVPLVTANGDVLLLTKTSVGKMADNHRSNGTSLSDAEFERKVNAAAHIDELVEVAEKARNKPKADKGNRHGNMASGGWDYYEAFFEDFDGKYYLVTISAAIGEDGAIVYNVGKMQRRQKEDLSAISGSSANGGAQNEKASFNDRVTPDELNVKEELSGESLGTNSYGRSFDEFAGDAQRLPTMDDSTSYTNALREIQQSGARQSKSYADELAHVNELLQNAALSPRDQAYIQEDIADAQRSCDAAMKVIVNPGTTADERARAVRRAIDALDYARQRIDDLGLPATQREASEAQEALADISEKLKPYLLEESAPPDTDMLQPPQTEWTYGAKPATIGTEDVLNFNATGEDFVRQIVDNPKLFGTFDAPSDLKLALENAGFEVKPLGDGQLKGIPFEDGGGYRINFSDGGVIMYHPEEHSHHGGAYYKISTGKGGTHRYDRYGKELRRKNR